MEEPYMTTNDDRCLPIKARCKRNARDLDYLLCFMLSQEYQFQMLLRKLRDRGLFARRPAVCDPLNFNSRRARTA
ncbi:hypothetical protein TNCV_4969271 [Trichonephila clavipes]|nr:hypothetical protein TNCV_4969271 [Trichonephila clavipes]